MEKEVVQGLVLWIYPNGLGDCRNFEAEHPVALGRSFLVQELAEGIADQHGGG